MFKGPTFCVVLRVQGQNIQHKKLQLFKLTLMAKCIKDKKKSFTLFNIERFMKKLKQHLFDRTVPVNSGFLTLEEAELDFLNNLWGLGTE